MCFFITGVYSAYLPKTKKIMFFTSEQTKNNLYLNSASLKKLFLHTYRCLINAAIKTRKNITAVFMLKHSTEF